MDITENENIAESAVHVIELHMHVAVGTVSDFGADLPRESFPVGMPTNNGSGDIPKATDDARRAVLPTPSAETRIQGGFRGSKCGWEGSQLVDRTGSGQIERSHRYHQEEVDRRRHRRCDPR